MIRSLLSGPPDPFAGRPIRAAGRSSRSGPRVGAAILIWLASTVALGPTFTLQAQEEGDGATTSTLVGRLLDLDESEPVPDAVVRLESTPFETVSDAEGLFRFRGVPSGTHVLVVEHVAYGIQRDSIGVVADETVAVRVPLSRRPISLEPVVVSVLGYAEREQRSRGTRLNEITRPEIEAASEGTVTLGEIVGAKIPGAWVRNRPSRPGQEVCVEFRQPGSVENATSCKYPMMVVDGVRIHDPGFALTGMSLGDVERVEVLSPAAAGLLYGTGSGWGVIVVETRRGLSREEVLGQEDLPYALGESAVYPWALEPDDHPWVRAFAGGLVGNAVGLTAGYLLARQCLESTSLSRETFRVRCGTWGTIGSQLAAAGLPILGTAVGTRIGGRTSASRGEFFPAILGSAVALIPGYVIATSGRDSDRGFQWLGAAIISFGVPAVATLADHLFRSFDSGE